MAVTSGLGDPLAIDNFSRRRERALRIEVLESRMLMATLPPDYQFHSNQAAAAKLFLDFDEHFRSTLTFPGG